MGATSNRELARRLGVSETAVRRAEKAGRIKRERDGSWDLGKVTAAWSDNTDQAQQRPPERQRERPRRVTLKPVPEAAVGAVRETLREHGEPMNSWDPGQARRGDAARALLYMDLRYDGSDSGTPDLELVDRTTLIGERHLGHLCTLLVWHEEDLVDDAEQRRNDVIFAWQGNRNPFVDHPEWVQSIWGDGCG